MNFNGGQLRSQNGIVAGTTFLGPRLSNPRVSNRACHPQASFLSARNGCVAGRLAGAPLVFMEGDNG